MTPDTRHPDAGPRPAADPSPAPFDAGTSETPDGARAVWLTAADGVRLRAGLLGHGTRGTVLLLQGRTEYLEKYGRTAAEFARQGLATVSVDFRGQGLSDRALPDRMLGHVGDFAEYQRDVAALAAFAEAERLPRPWFLVAHSMGGAIGLRALAEGLPVAAAVFSAPMWGVVIPAGLRPVAWSLGWLGHRMRLDTWRCPGTTRDGYVPTAVAETNLLTTDPQMLAYMQAHLAAAPDLDLGGPSLPWLYRALAECRTLGAIALPDIPSLVAIPSDEAIVCVDAMRRMIARWPGAVPLEIPGGRHETMMETEARRRLFHDACAAHFAGSA